MCGPADVIVAKPKRIDQPLSATIRSLAMESIAIRA
jgi:hypothetical protein